VVDLTRIIKAMAINLTLINHNIACKLVKQYINLYVPAITKRMTEVLGQIVETTLPVFYRKNPKQLQHFVFTIANKSTKELVPKLVPTIFFWSNSSN